jgi:hypothetical protein
MKAFFLNVKLLLKRIIQVHKYLVLILIMGAEVICKSACCFFSGLFNIYFLLYHNFHLLSIQKNEKETEHR